MENTKFYLFSQGGCRRDVKVVMRTAGSMLGGWRVLYSRQKKCPQDERIVEKAIGDPEDTHQNWLGTSYSSGDKARAYKVARSRRRRTLCRILSPGKLAVSVSCSAACSAKRLTPGVLDFGVDDHTPQHRNPAAIPFTNTTASQNWEAGEGEPPSHDGRSATETTCNATEYPST